MKVVAKMGSLREAWKSFTVKNGTYKRPSWSKETLRGMETTFYMGAIAASALLESGTSQEDLVKQCAEGFKGTMGGELEFFRTH